MVRKLLFLGLIAVSFAMLPAGAWATSVPVANSTFSVFNPLNTGCGTGCAYNSGSIPSWNSTGGGSWQPGSYFSILPAGTVIAYTYGGSISQTLTGSSLLANTDYTLTVDVGDRSGYTGTYTLYLDTINGGTTSTLCSFTGNSSTITAGTFQAQGCSYMSGSTPPSGQLYLLFTSGGGQLDISSVSLTETPCQSTSVPEPSSFLLLIAGLVFASFIAVFRKS